MSNRLPQSFLDELLTRTDIVALIETYIVLKKAGKNYKACCPFHSEKTPSFNVTPHKQMYHCFGCGMSGNAISFLMDYDHQSFLEAVASLAALCGLTLPSTTDQSDTITPSENNSAELYAVLQEASHFYQQQLRQHSAKATAVDYLKSRGLSGEVCKKFTVGFAPAGWDHLLKTGINPKAASKAGLLVEKNKNEPDSVIARSDSDAATQPSPETLDCAAQLATTKQRYYDRFRNRVIFPIRDRRGRTLGFGGRIIDPTETPKYLNSPETPVFQKRTTLYGLYEILQNRQPITKLMLVEGYMDVVALAQFGIHYALATLGTATTPEHLQLALRYTDHLIFCFDGDAAGRAAGWKALQTLLPFLEDNLQAEFLFLPANEDPDSLIRQEGKAAFEIRLQQATSFSQYFFDALSQSLNLRELEGQAKLAHLAAPLIRQIPGPLLRHKLLTELAERTEIEITELKKILNLPPETFKVQSFLPLKINLKNNSLMQQAITLLLQHPELAKTLPDLSLLEKMMIPGAQLFCELLALLHQTPSLSTAALIEHWRDKSIFKLLQRLASYEILITPEKISLEFSAILEKLMTQEEEQLIIALQKKADQNALTDAEKKHYLQLLTKRHTRDKTP